MRKLVTKNVRIKERRKKLIKEKKRSKENYILGDFKKK